MVTKKETILKYWSVILLICVSIAGIVLRIYFHIIPDDMLISFILLLICIFSMNQIIANEQMRRAIDDLRISKGIIKVIDMFEFYYHLGHCVEKAEKSIDLTIQQSYDPEHWNFKERQIYAQKIDDKILENRIRIRRITTINSIVKLELVKEWLKKYAKCSSFHLRYSPVSENKVPMPLSLAIIDNKTVLIANILKGCHTLSEENIDIYIEDSQLVKVFQKYYINYWEMLEPLKEGDWIDWEKINQIENSLRSGKN